MEVGAKPICDPRGLGICLAAGFVLAAGRRAIRFINQNIVVASRADDAINSFRELFVSRRLRGVLSASLFAAHWHNVCFLFVLV